MTSSASPGPTPHPGVAFRTLSDGCVVLLQLDTADYYSLNPTASLIWEMLAERRPTAEIAQTLSDRFDVAPAAAAKHIDRLIADLRAKQLLTAEDAR